MPSKNLQTRLDDLKSRGAKNLPDVNTIEDAPDGMEWAGVTADGTQWRLKKTQGDKYDLPT